MQGLGKEADKGGEPEALERTWLVEGSKAEVAAVLGRLGAFAKERNLVLKTGESVHSPKIAAAAPPVPDTPPGTPPDTTAGTEPANDPKDKRRGAAATSSEPARTKLLLRFRLLRR